VYLKRLEMLGFKSFAARTQLEFSPGITAVVGPNGAGKSNVADAMRWVLGEQNMRQLRGKKRDDIIFIGGQGHAPLGMAEVSLTLDNSTGWFPSEYSEITVTRRAYRSGENEYLINKQKVRLKDILSLLAQARIDHDSYTVVGQGLIDAALSLRAEERRTLFEDAAGIRPLQVQRTDAAQRLKQTEQSLERLRDIVNEITPRLGSLKEQAQKDRQCEQELQHLDVQVQQLREPRLQMLARNKEAHRANTEARIILQQDERNQAVNEERVTHLQQQQEDLQREERRHRERLITVQRQAIDLEEQCDLADENLDKDAEGLAQLESDVAHAQKAYTLDERRLYNAQNDLAQALARLSSSRSDSARQQKQRKERSQSLVTRRETITCLQQTLSKGEQRCAEEQLRLEALRSEEQRLSQQKQRIAQVLAEGGQELERIKATLTEAERRKRTTTDRLDMLKHWRQSLNGYSDGVRALLQAPAGTLEGLLGPVPQLGVVSVGMERALEAALGPYMQAVVIETLPQAMQGLSYLQQYKAGKAMIVWRVRSDEDEESSEVRALQEQEEEMVLQRYLETLPDVREQVIGFAWKLVSCDEDYIALFRRLLHGIVVTRTLAAAYELLRWALHLSVSSGADLPFHTAVTLDGEVLHVDGWLADDKGSGGKGEVAQGLLAHERELRELPQHLAEIDEIIEQVRSMMRASQSKQEARRREQSDVEKALHAVSERRNESQKSMQGVQREVERAQSEMQLAVSVEQQLVQELAQLEREEAATAALISTYEKTQHELAEAVDDLHDEMEERATRYRRLQDELGRTRTTLAVKRQDAKALRLQLTQQQTQVQELQTLIQQDSQRLQEVGQRRQRLSEEIAQQRDRIVQEQEQVQQLTRQLQLYEEERIRHEFLSTQIADLEQAALQLRAIIHRLDATMAKQFETTFQAVNTRFREHFTTLFNGGVAHLELVQAKDPEEDENTSERVDSTVVGMPSGVDIIVQPPGKKVQDLALLSGGERALVSAALLFALLEINPPPFCLLDEVDAALDESNVTRFCDILKRLTQHTQFIVITHNRVTMTGAQVIYGVSMRESVSRLLSLQLDEVPVSSLR
jgi:Chromosome segregation ATPases